MEIFLGFIFGYVVGNIYSRLVTMKRERMAVTMAQIQALRLFSQSVLHYGHLRQWHDNVAIGLDGIKESALEKAAESESLSLKELDELSQFWNSSYEQDLKSLWNNFEYDMRGFKETSVSLIRESFTGYGDPPYETWQQAMQWLAMFEMKLKQQQKLEDVKDAE